MITRATRLLFLTVIALSTAAFAQSSPGMGQDRGGQHGRGGMGNPQMQLDHLSQQLNLTDDQKQKILPILQDQSKQMDGLRQDSSLSQDDRRAKFQDIHQNTSKQIRAILTPEQQTKFDEMQKNRGEGRGWGHGRGMGQGQGQQAPPQ